MEIRELMEVPGYSGLRSSLRLELRRRVERGEDLRYRHDEVGAGTCGALRPAASHRVNPGEKAVYCSRLAGFGTDHGGFGRCRYHEGVEAGLPMWVGGEVGHEVVRHGCPPGRDTHGGTALMGWSISDIFARFLDDEEIAVMKLAMQDPVQLLGVVMGVRTAGLLRITRWLQGERERLNGVVTPVMLGAESSADKTAQTIARLAEARKGYLELESKQGTHDAVQGLLSSLTDDEFAKLKADPRMVAQLVGAVSAGDLMN